MEICRYDSGVLTINDSNEGRLYNHFITIPDDLCFYNFEIKRTGINDTYDLEKYDTLIYGEAKAKEFLARRNFFEEK